MELHHPARLIPELILARVLSRDNLEFALEAFGRVKDQLSIKVEKS